MTKAECINDSLTAQNTASRRLLHSLTQFANLLRHCMDSVGVWYERSRQRRALEALDDRLLKDIGLSRGDVFRETHKPFWRD